MPQDQSLLKRKADIRMPSAEGAAGYPRDLLDLSIEDLRELAEGNGHHNGNGSHQAVDDSESATADYEAEED